MSQTSKQPLYRIRNWREDNQALVKRGSLTIWVDRQAIDAWAYSGPSRRGAQHVYSDTAIQCLLTLRAAFHLPLRAAQGLGQSIFGLMGLPLAVPHYSTLCRRAADLRVDLARQGRGPLHLVLDSTGLKVYGEGQWKVRKHGVSKRRTWRKLHLAIDAQTHEVRAMSLTEAGVDDAEEADGLIKGAGRPLARVAADGAYDKPKVYEALRGHDARILIPPQRNARIWKHGNASGPPLPREENLRRIRRIGRAAWKEKVGYPIRSLAEPGMGRMKGLFGSHLANRGLGTPLAEAAIGCRAMNIMTSLGMPVTCRVL